MLDDKFQLKIVDFGLCAQKNKYEDNKLVSKCGTPGYAAPEVLKGHKYCGQKADVYSLGIILFVMVTKVAPFADFEYYELFQTKPKGYWKEFDKLFKVSTKFKTLIQKMLQDKQSSYKLVQKVIQGYLKYFQDYDLHLLLFP